MNQTQSDNGTALARSLLSSLDAWGVTAGEQVVLLGLPEGTKPRELNRFRMGTPLPDDEQTRQRVKLLLSIQNSLDHSFPHSADMANLWVTTENIHLNERTPLQVMLEGGLDGMAMISNHLNATDNW